MALANCLVYKGQLQAGSPAVETAQLVLPRPTALQQVRCSFTALSRSSTEGSAGRHGCCSLLEVHST